MVSVSVHSQTHSKHPIEAMPSRTHCSQDLASAPDLDDSGSSLPVAAAELTLPARTAPPPRVAPVPCFHRGLDRAAAASAAVVAAVAAAACC